MKSNREKIQELANQGLNHSEIARRLGLHHSSIKRHLSPEFRLKDRLRKERRGRELIKKLKINAGGKCHLCGYDKCLSALHFHHLDPATKLFSISNKKNYGIKKLTEEVGKCQLICANCHSEITHKKELYGEEG